MRTELAKDGLPGSAPYISRMCFGSFEISISSGALRCIFSAISNELIRVAISGSPTDSEPHSVELPDRPDRILLQTSHRLRADC
jgi:hypothetical protein